MSNNDFTIQNIFLAVMAVTFIAGFSIANNPTQSTQTVYAEEPQSMQKEIVVIEKVVEKIETPESYILEVFGEHADKAFLLLRGNGAGTCAENRNLDQGAYNRNWIKDKPGEYWSTDWGIFQINDHFHPVEKLGLRTNWKANIDYAWKMFVNDDFTFQRWSCGRYYGI